MKNPEKKLFETSGECPKCGKEVKLWARRESEVEVVIECQECKYRYRILDDDGVFKNS